MPTTSPITRDLAINGWGLTAVGVLGLIAAAATVKGGPGLVIIPFIIVALVFGLAQVVVSGGWLRTAVDAAAAPAEALVPEAESSTVRRAGLPCVIALVVVVISLFVWVQFAALFAGLAFAAGLMDLRSRAWITRLEQERGVVILREVTWLPFATSRRPLWAAPRTAS